MIPAIVVFLYLAVVLYIGIFAFRKAKGKEKAEDYFLASRSLGPFVFLFSHLRHKYDRVRDPRIVRSCLFERHRDVWSDGVIVGLNHSAIKSLIGTRVWRSEEVRFHDACADVSGSLGVRSHRHRDLCGAGRVARSLHHHRNQGGGTTLFTISGGLWLSGLAARSWRWW